MWGCKFSAESQGNRGHADRLAPFAVAVLAELADGYATDPSTGVLVAVPPAVRAGAAAELLKMSGTGAAQEIDLPVTDAPNPDLNTAIMKALACRGLVSGVSRRSDRGQRGQRHGAVTRYPMGPMDGRSRSQPSGTGHSFNCHGAPR